MKKTDLLSTLFVGIDVSSRENSVCAVEMAQKLQALLVGNRDINKLIVALEFTSFYIYYLLA